MTIEYVSSEEAIRQGWGDASMLISIQPPRKFDSSQQKETKSLENSPKTQESSKQKPQPE